MNSQLRLKEGIFVCFNSLIVDFRFLIFHRILIKSVRRFALVLTKLKQREKGYLTKIEPVTFAAVYAPSNVKSAGWGSDGDSRQCNQRSGRILLSIAHVQIINSYGSLAKIYFSFRVSAGIGLPSERKIEPDRRLRQFGAFKSVSDSNQTIFHDLRCSISLSRDILFVKMMSVARG